MARFPLSALLLLLCFTLAPSVAQGKAIERTRTQAEGELVRPTPPPEIGNARRQLPSLPGQPPVGAGGGTGEAGGGTGNQGTTNATTPNIPNNLPAGGLSYTQPAITAAASYYKIMQGNPITFGWTFTSLVVQPTSLTFLAYCAANSRTYPVGPATGIPGAATQIVWDPHSAEQEPGAPAFAQASYTLRVFDERGPTALASPGRFSGANAVVIFAMYSPAPYTPLAQGWTCAACTSFAPSLSAALSHPLAFALPATAAMFLIGGAGVLYR